MQDGDVVMFKLRTTPQGAISSWLIGKLQAAWQDRLDLSDVCKVYEVQSQNPKQPQPIYTVLNDAVHTEQNIGLPMSSVDYYRVVAEGHVIWKFYQDSVQNFRAAKSGIILENVTPINPNGAN